MRRMFRLYRRTPENPEQGRRELVKAGERLRRSMLDAPPRAANLARRFQVNGDAYLRFITHPEIEPTNNRAEQAIRTVVIDRAASQGTRSRVGRLYKERMWSAIATCAQRGVSVFPHILDALTLRTNPATAPP